MLYTYCMTAPRKRTTAPAGTTVAYLRVSTDEQVHSGAGLDAQRAAIEAEAIRKGWTITAWHADEGISGSKAAEDRPGLASALEAVQSQQAAVLIVAKLDRLSRSIRHATNLICDAEDQGWQLTACDGTVDMSTPASRFQTHIMAGVAELERAMISQRTRDALAVRKAQGVRLGRPATLGGEIVARIISEREAGRSLRAIGDGLTTDAVPTAQGGARWYAATVRAVLNGQVAAQIAAAPLRDELVNNR